jgi:hypothetical protein
MMPMVNSVRSAVTSSGVEDVNGWQLGRLERRFTDVNSPRKSDTQTAFGGRFRLSSNHLQEVRDFV